MLDVTMRSLKEKGIIFFLRKRKRKPSNGNRIFYASHKSVRN